MLARAAVGVACGLFGHPGAHPMENLENSLLTLREIKSHTLDLHMDPPGAGICHLRGWESCALSFIDLFCNLGNSQKM